MLAAVQRDQGHPYGPTQGVPNLRESHDDNSITFSWDAAPTNGRQITGYEIDGDRNTTVGPGARSTTFGGLDYDTARTIRIRAIAEDSGPGPWSASVTGRTNPRPNPKMTYFGRGVQCQNDCLVVTPSSSYQCGSGCYHLRYTLQDYQGAISCTFDGTDTNGRSWGADDGTGGTIEPSNGTNNSHKFYGLPSGSVTATCEGANGRDSFTANPWGP